MKVEVDLGGFFISGPDDDGDCCLDILNSEGVALITLYIYKKEIPKLIEYLQIMQKENEENDGY